MRNGNKKRLKNSIKYLHHRNSDRSKSDKGTSFIKKGSVVKFKEGLSKIETRENLYKLKRLSLEIQDEILIKWLKGLPQDWEGRVAINGVSYIYDGRGGAYPRGRYIFASNGKVNLKMSADGEDCQSEYQDGKKNWMFKIFKASFDLTGRCLKTSFSGGFLYFHSRSIGVDENGAQVIEFCRIVS